MEITTLIAIITLAITLGGVLVRHEQRFNSLVTRISILEKQVAPFWEYLQDNISALWRPRSDEDAHNPPSADLLTKLASGTISRAELRELEDQLWDVLHCGDHDPLRVLFTLWLAKEEKKQFGGDLEAPGHTELL